MKAYASFNPPYTLPPTEAEIIGIYATYIKPDNTRVPVRILHVEAPFKDPNEKVVIVRELTPYSSPFEVDRQALVFVQVFAVLGGR